MPLCKNAPSNSSPRRSPSSTPPPRALGGLGGKVRVFRGVRLPFTCRHAGQAIVQIPLVLDGHGPCRARRRPPRGAWPNLPDVVDGRARRGVSPSLWWAAAECRPVRLGGHMRLGSAPPTTPTRSEDFSESHPLGRVAKKYPDGQNGAASLAYWPFGVSFLLVPRWPSSLRPEDG
jgi:hypothetical protein